jgi:hypothetical protein
MVPVRFETFVAHLSPSTRPIAGRDRTRADSGRIHCETENPHCFCSISICFVMRVAFCA